jgi:hypothetical protein
MKLRQSYKFFQINLLFLVRSSKIGSNLLFFSFIHGNFLALNMSIHLDLT